MHFFPKSYDLHKKVERSVKGKQVVELYDPDVDRVLEQIAILAGQYSAARVVIEGHADTTMKGRVPGSLVLELSKLRVRDALLAKYSVLEPGQLGFAGAGWARPADPHDPDNHAQSRRVEIEVYSAEAPRPARFCGFPAISARPQSRRAPPKSAAAGFCRAVS